MIYTIIEFIKIQFFFFTACDQGLDIAVVIDASESVEKENFDICKQFVAKLTKKFQVSEQGTHFAVIVYSDKSTLAINLNDAKYYNAENLRKKIMSLDFINKYTRTDLALERASTDVFSVEGGDRPEKPNVLIIITDGNTHQDSTSYQTVLAPFAASIVNSLNISFIGSVYFCS